MILTRLRLAVSRHGLGTLVTPCLLVSLCMRDSTCNLLLQAQRLLLSSDLLVSHGHVRSTMHCA